MGRCGRLPGGIDEYLKRRAALEAQENSGVLNLGTQPSDAPTSAAPKRLSSQEERELTKKMNALERKMGKLDQQTEKLNEKMAAAAEAVDTEALTKLDAELKDVAAQREALEMEWLELGEQLEG